MLRLAVGTLVGAALTCMAAAAGAAEPARFAGTSDNALHIFFVTADRLAAGDRDRALDVYERAGGDSVLVSSGPSGGNANLDAGFAGTTGDGARAFFVTAERLTPDDADGGRVDVYERSGGTTQLLSRGNGAGAARGGSSASFAAVSVTGDVYFETGDRLDPANDSNDLLDVYRRSAGVTSLVSAGGESSRLAGLAPDGARAYFSTSTDAPGDSDGSQDVYQRDLASGAVSSISQGSAPIDAEFAAARVDGPTHRVFFATAEPLAAADTDSAVDVYETDDPPAAPTLVSGGSGPAAASFAGASDDGDRVFFETAESLDAADTDSAVDVYQATAGAISLISRGDSFNGPFDAHFDGASANGQAVYFETREPLASDSDTALDVYGRNGSSTVLATPDSATDVGFDAVSDDGVRMFFSTDESLTPEDFDGGALDVFVRIQPGGPTALVSRGDVASGSVSPATFDWASADGELVLFDTPEVLKPLPGFGGVGPPPYDADFSGDVYARTPFTASQTALISAARPDGAGARTRIVNPPKETRSRRPSFVFAASEPTFSFSCRIDAAPAVRCGPYFKPDKRLRPGPHRLRVSAVDLSLNPPANVAVARFRVLR